MSSFLIVVAKKLSATALSYHMHFACLAIGDLAEAAAHAGRSQAARERAAEVETLVGDDPAEWLAINLRHARALLAEDDHEAAARFEEAPQRGPRSLAILPWPAPARPRPVVAPPPARHGVPGTAA